MPDQSMVHGKCPRAVGRWLVRLSLTIAAGCLLVWAGSQFKPPQTLDDFLERGERVALARGFVYFDVSPPVRPDEQKLAQQMDELERRSARGESAPVATFRGSRSFGSGDRWVLLGWDGHESTRRVGSLSGAFTRRVGLWISPWAGTLAGLIPWMVVTGLRVARQHSRNRRLAAGRCPACGYDLRFSRGRCPECGRVEATG